MHARQSGAEEHAASVREQSREKLQAAKDRLKELELSGHHAAFAERSGLSKLSTSSTQRETESQRTRLKVLQRKRQDVLESRRKVRNYATSEGKGNAQA